MKKFILFACVFSSLLLQSPPAVTAQELTAYPYYVVIGAFAHHKNAIHFTDDANGNKFPARFEMNPNRNLYYVYVLTTADREYAIAEARKLRTDSKYWDTWVFSGPLGEASATPGGALATDFNPVTGEKIETVNTGNIAGTKENPVTGRTSKEGSDQQGVAGPLPLKSDRKAGGKDANTASTLITESPDNTLLQASGTAAGRETEFDSTGESVSLSPDGSGKSTPGTDAFTSADTAEARKPVRNFPKKVSNAPLTPEEVEGKNFYFQLARADNRQWIEGDVDAIDFERSRKMATYPANTAVKVIMPSSKSKQISFVCQVFGYRKQQIEFDPSNPSPDFYLDENGSLVVPFELVRLQKGDIAIMYNVFFFKDAAVMRPESRYEVNNLLELLNENPSYNIKIHGHTNGNASGKIIRMEKSDNFYSLSGTKQGFGSAKKLSEERAVVIRQFLIKSGIAEERMQVKAWGGKKPIHDKHSVRAIENVRVEIEILSD